MKDNKHRGRALIWLFKATQVTLIRTTIVLASVDTSDSIRIVLSQYWQTKDDSVSSVPAPSSIVQFFSLLVVLTT